LKKLFRGSNFVQQFGHSYKKTASLHVVDATAPPTAHPADPTTPTAAPPTVPITPPTAPPNQIYIVHGIWSNRKVVYLILPIRRNS